MRHVADVVAGAPESRVLLIADHASNHVPGSIDLRIPDTLLDEHVAVDIGIDPLARAIAVRLRCHAIVAAVSRLVVDFNRDSDEPPVIPVSSDSHVIPGNAGLSGDERAQRISHYWRPYHALVVDRIEAIGPAMLVSLHSFTPRLASRPAERRPWEVGVLYNQDERAAAVAIPLLRAQGIVTGDNQPYSGRELNATMNRHGEARGLPYLGLEVRQDLICDARGVSIWAERLAPVIEATAHALV